jgi:hypothetical protein
MISRPKKAVLIAKFSALNQAVANFKCKCQTISLVVKQIWYIPFLWSLAWYSYWIFRSALVFNTPLLQISAVDYLGASISIVALLIAGYRAREPIKRSVAMASDIGINMKKVLSHRDHLKESVQIPPLPRKTGQNTQIEIQLQPKPQLKNQPPVQSHPSPKKIVETKKPIIEQSSDVRVLSTGANRSSQTQSSKDFSTECLTCAKLVNCTQRQKRAMELSSSENHAPCRFAAELSNRDPLDS